VSPADYMEYWLNFRSLTFALEILTEKYVFFKGVHDNKWKNLTSKLAKSANKTPNFFEKISYGFHKTQNSMSLNAKKLPK
jgi:hypothetical protein